MKSESIGKLALALSKAQSKSDNETEGKLIHKILNPIIIFTQKENCNKKRNIKIFKRIAYGISDCWFWIGRLNEHGYGTYNKLLAHRVVWEMFDKTIQDGMYLLHICDVRNCVNPQHLYVGTQRDNVRDMMNRKRNANKAIGKKYVNL